jgi:hypothetical protein
LSEQGVQSAWQSLSARFDEQSPEFEVVTLGFSVGLGPNLLTDFMNRLNQLFADVVQEPARHARVYRAIASSLRSMESPPDNELQALLTTIDSNFGALIASDSTAAAKFALEVADRVIRYGSRAPQSAAAATQLAVTATQQAPLEVAQLLTLDEPV